MQSLEERKQEYRDELKKSFISFKKPVKSLSNEPEIKYISTWEIANTIPYLWFKGEELHIKNDRKNMEGGIVLIGFSLIIVTLPLLFQKTGPYILCLAFIIIGACLIVKGLDKKTKLTIDNKGIYYYKWKDCLEWKDIIATYIKEADNGEYIKFELLIFFYDGEKDSFFERAMPLAGLDTDNKHLGSYIEYAKTKAGFPTKSYYYSPFN